MENKAQMKRRIADIVHYKRYSRKLTVAAIALFISTGFIFYLFTGVAKENRTQSAMEQAVEKSFVDVKSVVDGEGTISAGIVRAGFPAPRAEVIPKSLYLMHDDVSYSYGEAGNILEVLREDHWVYPNHEAFRLSAKPEHRTVKSSLPVIMEPERKTETEKYQRQPQETGSSSLAASMAAAGSGSVFPGASPVKSGEKSAEKSVIEATRDASVPGGGPDDSDQHTGIQETGIVSGSNPGRAVERSKTVASTTDDEMMADVGNEMLPGSAVSHSMAKTDRGGDDDGSGFFVSDVDILPRVINAIPPQYPFKAKRDEITGYIKLRFIVTKDGDAIDTTVVESNPKGVFDKSALEAIESYRFKPGIKDGKAVDVQVNLPIKFSLS